MNPRALSRPAAVFLTGFSAVMLWTLGYSDEAALMHDGGAHFIFAQRILDGSLSRWLTEPGSASFSDLAHPNALSLVFALLGPSVKAGQLFNATLWGGSALLGFLTLSKWMPGQPKRSLGLGLAFALSPMLTSFGPKLYSEHLGVFGMMLFVWGYFALDQMKAKPLILATLGALIGLTTKSAFYPLALASFVLMLVFKKRPAALALGLALALNWPIHLMVEKGGRGVLQVADHTSRLATPVSILARCAAYNLSFNLGKAIFPEVEGACRLNGNEPGADKLPAAEWNPALRTISKMEKGYSYKDAISDISGSPFKYAFICLVTLPSALWIDGFYSAATLGMPGPIRGALFLFKAFFSTALWIAAFWILSVAWKERKTWKPSGAVFALFVPIGYFLALGVNMPVEQRHLMPLLPFLYLLGAIAIHRYLSSGRRSRYR